jgi:cytochrome bd-type quinol oxidase subunit 2
MDDEIRRRARRIEGKVDAVLGLVLLALGFWCADRVAALLQRWLNWPQDWIFFLSAIVFYVGFVIWYGRRLQRE